MNLHTSKELTLRTNMRTNITTNEARVLCVKNKYYIRANIIYFSYQGFWGFGVNVEVCPVAAWEL